MKRNEASSSRGSSTGDSVVVDVGRRRSNCGYCKSGRRSSIIHGLWAHSLTVYDYQDLLDRGWRRSGCFLYKPEMETTCCPQYTIRLKADDFVPSKEQFRVSRRMQRYLDGTWDGQRQQLLDKSDSLHECNHADEQPGSSQAQSLDTKDEQNSKEEELPDNLSEQIDLAMQSLVKSGELPSDIQFPKGVVKKVSQAKKRRLVEGSEDLLYTSNISFQIAAVLRRAKSDGKNVSMPGPDKSSSDVNESSSDLSPKTIAEKLANELKHLAKINELSIRACNGHINFYSAIKEAPHNGEQQSVALSKRASIRHENKVHDAIPEKMQITKRQLEICLKRSSFDPEEFALYKRYQMKVHNDEPHKVTESSYRRFLVDTPLIYVPPTGDNTVPPCGFGSFHQQYRIDGQLIAVGVVDILPKCLSSKYLFWDPDLAFLSLGKYSALKEINWVKENQQHCPSLQYYYLGYYIHSCSKMRYKAAYRPSELLCPFRYEWVPYDVAKPLLDRKKYVVLSDLKKYALLSLTQEPESFSVSQHDDIGDGDSNDAYVNGDEKMLDPDSESSDDEPFPETNDLATVPAENGDVGNLLLGMRGTRLRYKDLQRALGPADRANLESRLRRYMKVVGPQLTERMVYSLG